MVKCIDRKKDYKVSGSWLEIIAELCGLYNEPYIIYNEITGKTILIPFEAKRDFLIGKLIQRFENMEWEEI